MTVSSREKSDISVNFLTYKRENEVIIGRIFSAVHQHETAFVTFFSNRKGYEWQFLYFYVKKVTYLSFL